MKKVMLSILILFVSQLVAAKSSLVCSMEGLACMKGAANRLTQNTCTYVSDSCMDRNDNGNRANLNFPFPLPLSKLNCELRTLSCLKGATNISAENACGIVNQLCVDKVGQLDVSSQSDRASTINPRRDRIGHEEVDRGAGNIRTYNLSFGQGAPLELTPGYSTYIICSEFGNVSGALGKVSIITPGTKITLPNNNSEILGDAGSYVADRVLITCR